MAGHPPYIWQDRVGMFFWSWVGVDCQAEGQVMKARDRSAKLARLWMGLPLQP